VEEHLPIQVGRFNVTKTLRLARAYKNQVGRNEIIAFHPDNIADLNVLPLLARKCRVRSKNFGLARVEFRIGLVSFL
jgi:hypothetical protein